MDFLVMLMRNLGASMLGNILTGKKVVRAEKCIVRAEEGVVRNNYVGGIGTGFSFFIA